LYGNSVVTKIAAADRWICCDEFQFVRHGWVNRNRLSDGTWLVVPFDSRDRYAPINRVRIGQDARWRSKLTRTLQHRFGDLADEYVDEINRPWRLLAALNMSLIRLLFRDLGIGTPMIMQSHLESGKCWGPLDTSDADELRDVSERLARMTAEVGGTVWLSGPSGRGYLNEEPFHRRDIEVRYWEHTGPNPCSLELLLKVA
jgi:hypothetical protein